MVKSDLQGGTAQYNGTAYDCTVGTFVKRDQFGQEGGGISPSMMGDVQIRACDLPPGTVLGIGQFVNVMPNTGALRQCKIHQWKYVGPLIDLLLVDLNEKA
jgi:hypothetical protein